MKRRALLFLVFHLALYSEANMCKDVKVKSYPEDHDGLVWAEGYEGNLYRAEIKAKKNTKYRAEWQQITSEETRSGVIEFPTADASKCTHVVSKVVTGCSSLSEDRFYITFGVENPLDAKYNNTKLKFILSKSSSDSNYTCFEETVQVKRCETAEPYSVISNGAATYNAEGIVSCADNSTYLSAADDDDDDDDDGLLLSNIKAKCSSKAKWQWSDNDDLDDASCLPKPQLELAGNFSIIENNIADISCSNNPQSNQDKKWIPYLSINYNNQSTSSKFFSEKMQLSDHGKKIFCEVKIPFPEWILARSTQHAINILYSPRRLENIPITCIWNVTKIGECVIYFFSNPAADELHLFKGKEEISNQKYGLTSVNSAAGLQKIVYKTTDVTSKDAGIYQLQVVSSSFPEKILNINFTLVVRSSDLIMSTKIMKTSNIIIIPLAIFVIVESIVIAIISWKIHNAITKRKHRMQKNMEKSTCHRTGTLPTPSPLKKKDALYQECLDPYCTSTPGSITREQNQVYENEYELAEVD